MRLDGKTALITGGSRGIGRGIALRLAEEGADVVVNYFGQDDAAAEVVGKITDMGRRAIAVRADVTHSTEVERMVAETMAVFGRIDVLINNAGVFFGSPFLEMSEKDWDSMIQNDLKSVFLVCHAVAKQMVAAGRGKIVIITSECEDWVLPNYSSYCVAKAGARMLARCLSTELAKYRINVNSIAPTTVVTDLNREKFNDRETFEKEVSRIPLGRLGVPEDIAAAALFLVSAEADFITGISIPADGGANT